MGRKRKGVLYLTVTAGDGAVLVAEVGRKDETAAREFAARFNTVSSGS